MSIVKDVNTLTDRMFEPEGLYSAGAVAYFTHQDPVTGYELWKTDGTTAGTVLVKDIVPGAFGSAPSGFALVGSTVYFAATTPEHGRELWKTDGTSAGTVMVADAVPGTASSSPSLLRGVGSQVIYLATTAATGYEPWKSDGTAAGTSMIVDLRPGTSGQQAANDRRAGVAGSSYLFIASNGSTSGVYRTDGTAAGTTLVKASSGAFFASEIISAGARAVLTNAVSSSTSSELYVTTGTAAGTTLLASPPDHTKLAVAGTNLFYVTYDFINGETLNRIPLAGGSSTFISLPANVAGPLQLFSFGTSLAFTATHSSTGVNLYRVTNSGLSATLLKDFTDFDNSLFDAATAGSTLYFKNATTQTLWKSDGTTAGTVSLTSITDYFDSFDPAPRLVVAGTRAVFINSTPANGIEVWGSNGTTATTFLLKDINTSTAAYGGLSFYLGRVGNTLYYRLNDGIAGDELWKTDGTAAGTMLVKDIVSGSNGSSPLPGVALNGKFLFAAYDSASGYELWTSDGTSAGTSRLADLYAGANSSDPSLPVVMNGIAYFSANTSANGYELWRTDGTAAGTVLVKDIVSGTASSGPRNLIAFNGKLYFAATGSGGGEELYVSDGTSAGTSLLVDLYPGPSSSAPARFAVAGGRLFFAATTADGTEPWSTDGTPAGTAIVANLSPGSASSSPGDFVLNRGALYFTATTSTTGRELFKIDLATRQASLAAEFTTGTSGTTFGAMISYAGEVYVVAGAELYQHATAGTTTKLTNFLASGNDGIIGSPTLTAANGRLFVSAYMGMYGFEMVDLSGIVGDPVGFTDVFAGIFSGAPFQYNAIPGATIMTGASLPYGTELHRIADTLAPRVWDKSFDVNAGQIVRAEFTEAISLAGGNSASIMNLATGLAVPGVSVVRALSADATRVDFTFSATLPDGNYRLQFNAADYRDGGNNLATGGTLQVDFHILAGDANRDRVVNFDDLLILAQNYGQTGRSFTQGNFNYSADGRVDFDDLLILAQRYGTSLAVAPTPMAKKRSAAKDVIA